MLESYIERKRKLNKTIDILQRTPIERYMQCTSKIIEEIKTIDTKISNFTPEYREIPFIYNIDTRKLYIRTADREYIDIKYDISPSYLELLTNDMIHVKSDMLLLTILSHLRNKTNKIDIIKYSIEKNNIKFILHFYL